MLHTRLVITVAQAEGSFGREIAEQLAASLQLTYVDEAVLRLATENLNQLEIESYLQKLAQHGRLLILGCAANFSLSNLPWVINLLILAPLQTRLARIKQKYQIDQEIATRRIHEFDGRYTTYTRQFYGQDWANPAFYDLTLNTESLSVTQSVQALSQFIQTLDYRPQSVEAGEAEAAVGKDELNQRYHKAVELLTAH